MLVDWHGQVGEPSGPVADLCWSSGRPGMNYLENCPNKPVPGDNRLVGVALVATCTAPYMERARVGHVGFQLVSSSDRQLQPHDNAILPGAQFVWLLLPTRDDAHNFFTLPNRSTCSTIHDNDDHDDIASFSLFIVKLHCSPGKELEHARQWK
ncbi:hypothetical protein T12_6808 [Trichinella patagoniensis]|uniref:Uncharacterized protein n=1 Tax=Trichinella patagoniensis TaxID=990121 RepID=A0A0V0ZHM3_9BILA|nr:hypothetical protein T12_6808 [Trichinella patagoniensis]